MADEEVRVGGGAPEMRRWWTTDLWEILQVSASAFKAVLAGILSALGLGQCTASTRKEEDPRQQQQQQLEQQQKPQKQKQPQQQRQQQQQNQQQQRHQYHALEKGQAEDATTPVVSTMACYSADIGDAMDRKMLLLLSPGDPAELASAQAANNQRREHLEARQPASIADRRRLEEHPPIEAASRESVIEEEEQVMAITDSYGGRMAGCKRQHTCEELDDAGLEKAETGAGADAQGQRLIAAQNIAAQKACEKTLAEEKALSKERAVRAEQHLAMLKQCLEKRKEKARVEEMRLEDDASRSIMQLPSPASQKIPKKTVAVAVLAVAGLVGAWERGGLREKFIGSVMAADGRPERNAMAQFDVSAAMEDFEVERVLGTGMVGSVSLASCPGFGCGKEFALKKIKEGTDWRATFSAKVEMAVFVRLAQQPHNNAMGALAIDDRHPLMPMILPKAEGDYFSVMESTTWTIADQLSLLVDVADGALHLHQLGIVHRDIKPENVLVFHSEELGVHAKLADFGLAKEVGEECPGVMGSLGFMPLEVLTSTSLRADTCQDVFAVAALLLQVCAGREMRRRNMFTHEVLLTAEEKKKSSSLDQSSGTFHSDMAKLDLEVEVSKRTMTDGSFERDILVPAMMNEAIESRDTICYCLPFYLTANPSDRQDLASLRTIIDNLAEEAD